MNDAAESDPALLLNGSSENPYRMLFMKSPVPMLVFEEQTLRCTEANESASACYGYSPEELRSMTLTEMRARGGHSLQEQFLAALLKNPADPKIERFLRKDGSEARFESSYHRILSRGVPCFIQVLRHLENSDAVREMLEGESRILGSILHSMGEGVIALDPDWKLILSNLEAERILGMDPKVGFSKEWARKVLLADGKTACPHEQFPLTKALRGEEVPEQDLVIRSLRTLDLVRIAVNARPVYDELGKLKGAVFLFRDITARFKTEEALRDSEKRLGKIVSQAGVIAWTTNLELRITSIHGGGMSAIALDPRKTIGMTLSEYFGVQDPTFLPIAMHRRALLGDSVRYEIPWANRHFTAFVEPKRDDEGRILGTVGLAIDLTERRRLEESMEERTRELERDNRELETSFQEAGRRIAKLEEEIGSHGYLRSLVGSSYAMENVFRLLNMAARSDSTVLLTGESGTGKELAARAIHSLSSRRNGPFIAINCSALSDSLLESELFGHVKGSFTGAYHDKTGVFEVAKGGTLFLDEVGDMSANLQLKLLRVLQEREIRRVGDDHPISVDIRLITATHRDLTLGMAQGSIRNDFYYRIRVFEIQLPALRTRKGDIPLLIQHLLLELSREQGRTVRGISKEALQLLVDYPWPGNVRELRNAIEHAMVTLQGDQIEASNLPGEIQSPGQPSGSDGAQDLSTKERQREQILDALRRCDGNRTRAAKLLGISRVTLWHRMRHWDIP